MAITLVADSGAKVLTSGTEHTYAFVPGVCDFLYLFAYGEGNTLSATYNSVALNEIVAGPSVAFFNQYLYIFRSAVDPSATSHNIIITPSTGTQAFLSRTISLLGVNRSSPDGATYNNTFANAASPFTSSAIVTAVGDWVLSAMAGLTDQNITIGADQTNESEPDFTYHWCTSTKPADDVTETVSYSYSADMFRAAVALVVQAAGAGGGATNVSHRAGRRFSRARLGGGRVSYS